MKFLIKNKIAAFILCFVCASVGFGQTVRTLLDFDAAKGEFAENLAIDKSGNVYVTLLLAGDVLELKPDGTQARFHLDTGGKGSVTGITFDRKNQLFVAVNSDDAEKIGVWQIERQTKSIRRVAALPTGSMLNGLTADSAGNLYVADSRHGIVWRIRSGAAQAEKWLQNQMIAPADRQILLPNGTTETLTVGANGLRFRKNKLYISVSGQAAIVAVKINKNGSAGAGQILYQNIFADDFNFDERGNLLTTANRQAILTTSIEKITKSGKVSILATAADNLQQPSSIAVGRRGGEKVIYLTNLGLFGAAQRPSLQIIRLEQLKNSPAKTNQSRLN